LAATKTKATTTTAMAKAIITTKATKATVTSKETKQENPTSATTKKKAKTTTAMVKATKTTKATIATVTCKETKQANPTSATIKESEKVQSFNAREIIFTASSSVMDCNICQKTICLNGQTATSFLNKMTACCGTSTTVHVRCAMKFSKCLDSCYEFEGKTYVSNSAIKRDCPQCKKTYFYCGENHVINNKDLSIIVCTECKKSWSYHVNLACKKKYDRNISKPPVCVYCNVRNKDRDNISIQHSLSSLAHSQYLSPISSSISSTGLMEPITNLINTLLIKDGTSLDDFRNIEECKEFNPSTSDPSTHAITQHIFT